MSQNKIPDFYTSMINKLENLDVKVDEIQNSIRIFKAMINERIGIEKTSQPEQNIESKDDS